VSAPAWLGLCQQVNARLMMHLVQGLLFPPVERLTSIQPVLQPAVGLLHLTPPQLLPPDSGARDVSQPINCVDWIAFLS
jgi:hypothetical protein